jgi:hypothetical protein
MTTAQIDPPTAPDVNPRPDDSANGHVARLVGHRDSPASSGPDLAARFNAFLASMSDQGKKRGRESMLFGSNRAGPAGWWRL